jgi:hypothetical protein
MGIDGNEIADQLTRQGSSHALTGPERALGVSAKFARVVIRDWVSTKHEECWQYLCGQRWARAFLKKSLQKKVGNCSI